MSAGSAFGPWLLERQLGVGGMAEVWLASHRILGRRIAVKILAHEFTRDPKFKERFVAEAQVQARLSHPHIAQIQDFVEENGQFAILMEWIPGGTIADAITRACGPLPLEHAVKWAGQAFGALDHAHRHGVIHRDMKPANLMLDANWDVKITDFGIAVAMGGHRMTATGRTVGTPQYMSPEQILRPRAVDHRTDIYSMGIVMFEMLTGRVPFDAETEFSLLKLHIETRPPSLRTLNPTVPDWLEAMVLRCLEKDPDDRYQGCAAAAEALIRRSAPPLPVERRTPVAETTTMEVASPQFPTPPPPMAALPPPPPATPSPSPTAPPPSPPPFTPRPDSTGAPPSSIPRSTPQPSQPWSPPPSIPRSTPLPSEPWSQPPSTPRSTPPPSEPWSQPPSTPRSTPPPSEPWSQPPSTPRSTPPPSEPWSQPPSAPRSVPQPSEPWSQPPSTPRSVPQPSEPWSQPPSISRSTPLPSEPPAAQLAPPPSISRSTPPPSEPPAAQLAPPPSISRSTPPPSEPPAAPPAPPPSISRSTPPPSQPPAAPPAPAPSISRSTPPPSQPPAAPPAPPLSISRSTPLPSQPPAAPPAPPPSISRSAPQPSEPPAAPPAPPPSISRSTPPPSQPPAAPPAPAPSISRSTPPPSQPPAAPPAPPLSISRSAPLPSQPPAAPPAPPLSISRSAPLPSQPPAAPPPSISRSAPLPSQPPAAPPAPPPSISRSTPLPSQPPAAPPPPSSIPRSTPSPPEERVHVRSRVQRSEAVSRIAPRAHTPHGRPVASTGAKRQLLLTVCGAAALVVALGAGWRLTHHNSGSSATPNPGSSVSQETATLQQPPANPASNPRTQTQVRLPPEPSSRELSQMQRGITAAIRAGNWTKANSLIDKLLAKFPSDQQTLEWQSMIAGGKQAELLEKLNPNATSEAAQIAKAEDFSSAGQYDAAIKILKKVLAGDPDNPKAKSDLNDAEKMKGIIIGKSPETPAGR